MRCNYATVLSPGGGEKSAGAHHKYGRIGTELLVEGEPMEEHVVVKLHPSATPPSAFADRPAYKWWVTWTIMVGSFLFALERLRMCSHGTLLGHFSAHISLVSPTSWEARPWRLLNDATAKTDSLFTV